MARHPCSTSAQIAIRPGLLTNNGVIEGRPINHKNELSHGDRDSLGSMGASGSNGLSLTATVGL